MRSRFALGTLAVAATCVVLGCDVPAPTTPDVQPGIVVFSILDPTAIEQVVLLMATRTALPDTTGLVTNVDDPIVTSGETPIRGATVVLYGPTGDSAVAIEDRVRRTDRLGAGVYRVFSGVTSTGAPVGDYMRILAGQSYRLRIVAPSGSAEGTTRVPSTDRTIVGPARILNGTRDSVLIGNIVTAAAGYVYMLRNANSTGVEGDPQYRRALERTLVLPAGGSDWAFAYARERLRAATRHTLTVTAADSNYFAYYSAQTDPFADRTGRTTLRGAAGVFGSVLPIYSVAITVSVSY